MTARESSKIEARLAEIERRLAFCLDSLHEIREYVLINSDRKQRHRTDIARSALFSSQEQRISLEAAAKMVWGKLRSPESIASHVQILENWANEGIVGAVLETDIADGKRVSSREAVERFLSKINYHIDENKRKNRLRPKKSSTPIRTED